jgi:hypothetical protein
MFTLLPCIHEHKDVIGRDTNNKEDTDDMEEAKVRDLENSTSDDGCRWETQKDD